MNELRKISKDFIIEEIEDKKTFKFKNKNEEVIIYDDEMIDNVIDKKFMKSYKKILSIILDIESSDDATDSDAYLVRDEIERLKEILYNKYKKHLKTGKFNRYLKMLELLYDKVPTVSRRGR